MRGREIGMEPPLAGSNPCLRLCLLGLTDLHANLYPYDYFRDCPDNLVGLARAASLIAEPRNEAPNCLLFDLNQHHERPLLGPAFAAYNFDVIDDVDYTIDITQPARYPNRVRWLHQARAGFGR
jgi:2',3'-cyclic-nucleotide 2'-phosphodiesterase (5'-nucleotidase family)